MEQAPPVLPNASSKTATTTVFGPREYLINRGRPAKSQGTFRSAFARRAAGQPAQGRWARMKNSRQAADDAGMLISGDNKTLLTTFCRDRSARLDKPRPNGCLWRSRSRDEQTEVPENFPGEPNIFHKGERLYGPYQARQSGAAPGSD